jgi:hypothetical protein
VVRADGVAVVAIEERLFFLPDDERGVAAVVQDVGFELGILLRRERGDQGLKLGG